MNLSSKVTDNITDLLVKIIHFTSQRHHLLVNNINNINTPGYIPYDLPVDEFAALMDCALNEHIQSSKLMLCDTSNIKFRPQGKFEITPCHDQTATELLEQDPDEYLELQLSKLTENTLNQKIAKQLIEQKNGVAYYCD